MSISDRYRDMVAEVEALVRDLEQAPDAEDSMVDVVRQASRTLAEYSELVGEIPRMKLESELTPVLLKAHSKLDRARLLFEEGGSEALAGRLWEEEQKIYRLLNDL